MTYFTTNPADIGRISIWLRSSLIALVVSLVLIKGLGVERLQSSLLGFLVGVVALGSLIAYLILIFLLTRSLDPKPSLAWTVLLLQLIPILGFIVAISTIIKGIKVSRKLNPSTSDIQPEI